MISLNQAGTSWPKPAAVQAAVAEALRASPSDWTSTFQWAHELVAASFGIADPARLLLTPAATSALAVGVSDHPWERGDRVLVSGLEHHAVHRPASLLGERGVELGVIPRSVDAPLDLGQLRSSLEEGRVRLVAMTAACNVTGELLPVAEVVRLAHEHGALCLIDGAQVVGWLPVDVQAWGVDLFAFAGHKALHAPWGLGGLYVAPHVSMISPSAVCELPVDGEAAVCNTMPGYCDVGSVDRVALAGLAAALQWLEQEQQLQRLLLARQRIERLTKALEARPDVTLYGARDPERRLPTVAFTIRGRDSTQVAADFARAGILVGSGLQCAPLAHESLGTAPEGVVRLSVGPMHSDRDIEHVLRVVEDV